MGLDLGTISASVGLNTGPLAAGTAQAKGMMSGLDAAISSSAKSATFSMNSFVSGMGKLAIVGTAAVLAIGVASFKMAADFDESLHKAGAVADASQGQMDEWGKKILELSTQFSKPAKEMADALYWIKSDMPDATDAQQWETLNIAIKGSVGGVASLEDATEALIVVQNAYVGSGVELQGPIDYMDAMEMAVKRGSITLQDFVANMGKATGTAAMAKVPFTDIAAAVATLTKKGVPVETAFMALNQTMMRFLKPTKEASEVAQKFGIDLSLTGLRSKGLAGALMEIADKVPDTELANMFSDVRALKAVLPLAGVSVADFATDLAAMGADAGTTEKMFAVMEESMSAKMGRMLNNIKKPLIEIGEKLFPTVESAMGGLTRAFAGQNGAVNNVVGGFGSLIKVVTSLGSALIQVKPALYGVIATLGVLKGAALFSTGGNSMSAGFNALHVAAANAMPILAATGGIITGIGIAAAAVAVGLGVWIYKIKAGDAAGQKAAETIRSMDKANEALGLQMQPLIDRYEVLRATQGRSAEQEAELVSLGNQIAALAPTMAAGFDLQGNAIIKSDAQLKTLIADLLQYSAITVKDKGTTGQLEGLLGSKAELEKTAGAIRQQLNYVQVSMNALSADTSGSAGRNAVRLLSTDFKAGAEAVKAFVVQLRESGRIDPVGPASLGLAGNAQTVKDLEVALASLDGMYTQNKMTLSEVIKKINETDIAMAQLKQQMMQTAAAGGFAEGAKALTDSIIASLKSQTPTLRETGMNQMAAVGQGMLQARGILGADATTMSQHIANLIASGANWDGTGGQAGLEVYNGLKTQLGASLPGVEAATKAIADGMKVTFTGNPANPIIIEPAVTDPIPTANNVTTSLNNWFGSNQSSPIIGIPIAADPIYTASGVTTSLNNWFGSHITHPIIGAPSTQASPLVKHSSADEAGAYLAKEVVGGMQGTFAANQSHPVVGGSAMSDLASATALARASFGNFISAMTAEPLNEVNDAIFRMTNQNSSSLADWWKLRGAYDAATKSLANYTKQIEAGEKAITSLEAALERPSLVLGKQQSELELKIMKAEDAHNYALAAKLNIQKDTLDRKKEELDLTTQIADETKVLKDTKAYAGLTTAEIKAQLVAKQAQVAALKITFDKVQASADTFKKIIDDLGGHFVKLADASIAAEEAAKNAAEAAAKKGGGGYAAGTNYVPRTGMALVHQGEQIIPANLNPLTLGSGSTTLITVPLYLDGKVIAKSVSRYQGGQANSRAMSGGKY